ncbi:MAG TPA: hypothetical protein VML01_04990 [Bryobacterales bacterium]|nr:hypothetical protein [Bryobacterales bacterium]
MLESRVLEFNPDAILYVGHVAEAGFTLEDVAKAISYGAEIPYEEIRAIIREADPQQDFSSKGSARARLAPYTNAMSEWAWSRIIRHCRDRGIAAYLAMIPSTLRDPATPAQRAARVVEMERHGFIAFDLSAAFDVDLPARELVVAPWDAHPSALGQRLLADTLYEQWHPHLSEARIRKAPGTQ